MAPASALIRGKLGSSVARPGEGGAWGRGGGSRGSGGAAYRRGFEAVRPLVVTPTAPSASEGLDAAHSFLGLEPSHLVVTAVKSPYDGDSRDLVVPFVEINESACTAKLQVPGRLEKAFETKLLEEDPHPLALASENGICVQVKPYEIKTLRLALAPASLR